MKKFLLYFSFLILFSCEKEEIPISPHQAGDIITQTIGIGQDYRNQIFYQLSTNSIISQNIKTEWDIAFESNVSGWRIFLNSSLGGGVYRVSDMQFESLTSIDNPIWNWDAPSGNKDSTAIGNYQNQDVFFVIDRGYNISGNPIGYIKLRVESVNELGYYIRYSSIDNSNDTSLFVSKDPNKLKTCFSFSQNNIIDIEPNINKWDLLFTQYLHVFSTPPTPYLVTGLLINDSTTKVALDSINTFENINLSMLSEYDFKDNRDYIGYDWKVYNFSSGNYSIINNKNYIIQDALGRHFKLRFIDYYNDIGEKGYPKFELQEL